MRFALTLAALTVSAATAFADSHKAKAIENLHALNDRFNEAVARHDADDLLDLYAEDILWIAQGTPPAQGLEEPRKLFEFVTANKGHATHTIDHLFVSDDASLAVMIGTVEARVKSVGMDATGTYLFVLQPQGDVWKVVTDMWHQHDGQ